MNPDSTASWFKRFANIDRDLRLIFLSTFLWGFGLFLYIFLQPLYVTQLGANPAQVGATLGVGSFIAAILYAPIGLWADRHGRKSVILLGWSIGAVSAFFMALAPDWRWFIPAIGLYTFSNFAGSVLNGYIASKVSGQQRIEAYALLSAGPAIGSILAPAIGGWIGEHFGLRVVYGCAAFFFSLSALSMCFIRSQPREEQATTQVAVNLLREGRFMWNITVLFCIFFAVDVGQVLAPKFLEEVHGFSIDQIGWLGSASATGMVLLLFFASRMPIEKTQSLIMPQVLVILLLASVAFLPFLPFLIPAYFISGSNRLIRTPSLARMSNLLTPASMSFGLGIYQTAMQFGYSVSPYVAGLLYDANPSWPLYFGMGGLLCTILLTLTLRQVRK